MPAVPFPWLGSKPSAQLYGPLTQKESTSEDDSGSASHLTVRVQRSRKDLLLSLVSNAALVTLLILVYLGVLGRSQPKRLAPSPVPECECT